MSNEQLLIINNKEILLRKISIKDKSKVMDLFRACTNFFELTEGIQPDDCEDFFYALPPNKRIEDKYSYGIFDEDLLIGAIDIIADYPEKGEWIIGLLLLHPNTRGIGLGKEIHNQIKELVKNKGGEKLRVGVMEQNTNALTFWNKMGYKQTKITEPIKSGIKESKVVVMNYYI